MGHKCVGTARKKLHEHTVRCLWRYMMASSAVFVILLMMMTPLQGLAQETGIAKEEESLTPKADMIKQIIENTKWGAADRPMEALYEVDTELQKVRKKIKGLRAALLGSSTEEAKQDELDKYVKVSDELTRMKKDLETIQMSMTRCKSMCSRMEMAAAEGQELPQRYFKVAEMSDRADMALESFKKSLANLKKLATDLKNTKILNLAKELENDAEALEKAYTLCKSCLKETSEEQSKTYEQGMKHEKAEEKAEEKEK